MTIEPSVLTPALQFGMLADRARIALWKVENRQPLCDGDRRSLENVRSFLEKAITGGGVLETRSMANYSFEAMSAYEAALCAVQSGEQPTATEVQAVQSFLRNVSEALKAVGTDTDLPQGWTIQKLTRFLRDIVAWCLRATSEPVETVSY
jgi:hypothetical protein